MDIPVIVIIIGIAALFVLLVVARRVLRFAIRLALAGVLILIFIFGGVAWWWLGPDHSANRNTQRPGNVRPTSSR